jgi:hypothetical protein
MTATTVSMPFSVLLRHPNRVTAELDQAGSVRLTRRDEDDLVLVRADSHEAASEGVSTTAHLLGALVAEGVPTDVLARALSHACPWTRFLPDHSLDEFVADFVATALACAEIGRFQPLTVLLHAWRSTAAIHADPHLSRVLREQLTGDDFGQVEAPE